MELSKTFETSKTRDEVVDILGQEDTLLSLFGEGQTEIIEFLDVPIETKVETRIYELVHAQASEVASRLNELIQQAQTEQNQSAGRRPTRSARGVIRPGQRAARAPCR